VLRKRGLYPHRITEDGNLIYLLLQATAGKPYGFPKGKIDPGESEEEAARREIQEEAGLAHIDFAPDFRHVVQYTYRRGRAIVKKEVIYFLASTASPEVHLSWEHVAFMWAPLDEALELVHYENARELLRKAHKYLEAHLNL
jgi:8-oxo-dGTP pyrophosphatase MutT (NUDIX family)